MKKRMKRARVPGINNKKPGIRAGNRFRKKLFLEVTTEIYDLVKERSGERNISMRLWVTRAIVKELKGEFRAL